VRRSMLDAPWSLFLFKFWKGSDLEDTHLTHPDWLSMLLTLVTLTCVGAWRVEAAEHERAPGSVLSHGRLASPSTG
jgi:hypothetical protein